MGKYKENPRYHVVSIRISDNEFEALANESHTTNKSISDLMRAAMSQYTSNCVNTPIGK